MPAVTLSPAVCGGSATGRKYSRPAASSAGTVSMRGKAGAFDPFDDMAREFADRHGHDLRLSNPRGETVALEETMQSLTARVRHGGHR